MTFEEALKRLMAGQGDEALAWMRDQRDEVIDLLFDALAHPKKRIRLVARKALIALEASRDLETLERLLRHPETNARIAAAEWMEDLDLPPDRAPFLLGCSLGEDDDDLRFSLMRAWRRLVEADDVHLLVAEIHPARPRAHQERVVEALLVLLQGEPRELDSALRKLDPETLTHLHDLLAGAPPSRARDVLVAAVSVRVPTPVDEDELAAFGRIIASPTCIAPPSPLLHAERAVEAIEQRLSENGSCSLVVVGPSGSGKTALLNEVFRRRAARGATVLSTTTSLVMAGTKYLGEWQTRVRDLVNQISKPRDVIVYFGDINVLTMTGRSDTSADNFASFLKPYIEAGEITVVGESTPEELAVGLNRSPDVKRLFREVKGVETTRPQTREILAAHAAADGAEGDVSPVVVEQVLDLADLYLPDGVFPGKAVDLLGQTLSRLRRMRGEVGEITVSDLVSTLAERTGLPQWLLDDRTELQVDAVRTFFGERILGQEHAVDAIVDLITLIKAGLTDPKKPFAVLFFVGPTGVGKTEIAKALAEFLFGDAERLVRLDMSEFKTYEGYERLIGTASWNPHNEEGILTRRVRSHPFSVVLLDEFEKAHPNVYDLMLQVFDDGRLTSRRGEVVSFRQTIVIMTSNLGSGRGSAPLGFVERDSSPQRRDVMRALEEYFRPEFLNRVDRVVVFDPLDIDVMRRVARREIDKVLRRSGIARRGLLVEVGDGVVTRLLQEGFSPVYGARPLKRVLEREVLLPLARRLVAGLAPGSLVRVSTADDRIRIRVLPPPEDDATETRKPREEAPPADLLAAVRGQLENCRRTAVERGLEHEKETLLDLAHADDFWKDSAKARAVTERVRVLDGLLNDLRQAEQDLDEMTDRAGARLRTAKRLHDLSLRVARLHLHFGFCAPRDMADAWIALRRLDVDELPFDPVARMGEMYAAWAERDGCECLVADLRADGRGTTQMMLRIVGSHAFGLLRGEAGLHRFAHRTAHRGGRSNALVRVDVIAGVPPDALLPPAEVSVESRALPSDRRKGAQKPRSWTRAIHHPSLLVAEGVNALSVEENREAMLEQLAALVAHDASIEGPDIVRVYYTPENQVRDLVTGVRAHDAEEVLQGDLTPFVMARATSST